MVRFTKSNPTAITKTFPIEDFSPVKMLNLLSGVFCCMYHFEVVVYNFTIVALDADSLTSALEDKNNTCTSIYNEKRFRRRQSEQQMKQIRRFHSVISKNK